MAAAGEKKKAGWFGLFGGIQQQSQEEDQLRSRVKEYEQKLAEMQKVASQQASDISSLKNVAEQTMHEKAIAEAKANALNDEERWKKLMSAANSTQEQALAQGQKQLHELAASLQAAQRAAAQQQAIEWRQALHEASEAHADVVEQLQSQLKATRRRRHPCRDCCERRGAHRPPTPRTPRRRPRRRLRAMLPRLATAP